MTNLFCDVRLSRRIALRWVAVLSSTGFSLCIVDGLQLKPHRLKPVLLDRAGPVLSLLAANNTGNFQRVHMRNANQPLAHRRMHRHTDAIRQVKFGASVSGTVPGCLETHLSRRLSLSKP